MKLTQNLNLMDLSESAEFIDAIWLFSRISIEHIRGKASYTDLDLRKIEIANVVLDLIGMEKDPEPVYGPPSILTDSTCVYCGRTEKELGHKLQKDHFIPRSKGGSNAPDNIVRACPFCNSRKGARSFKSISDCKSYLHSKNMTVNF